jgi:aspartate racemase
MKTLGLVGGTGWVSTLEYYRLLNEGVARCLGGHDAARCVVYSLNFGDVMRAKEGDPEQLKVREMVIEAAGRLVAAGADGLLLCANTLHWFANAVERAVPLPLIHIADAVGDRIVSAGLERVALLGTRPTMEREFYRERLEAKGLEVRIPDEPARTYVHQAIYDELVLGRFLPSTRAAFVDIVTALQADGAQGVVLGCTEIPLLLTQSDCSLPLFDTLAIHAEAGVRFLVA